MKPNVRDHGISGVRNYYIDRDIRRMQMGLIFIGVGIVAYFVCTVIEKLVKV